MAAIDPDVDDLLTALLATPLAFCAQAAIDSIVDQSWDDPEDRFFDRERGGFHPERRSRNGQLDMADRVISGRVKREIRMLRRLRELAPELGLTSVGVLPGPAGVRAGYRFGRRDRRPLRFPRPGHRRRGRGDGDAGGAGAV